MPSEAKRAFWRISLTYARLALSLGIGLVLLPVLVSWLGLEGFGFISLLGFAVFSPVFQEVTEQSLVRELAAAHHSGDESNFRRRYNSAYIVSTSAALGTVLIFACIFLVLPSLNIPREWLPAARWMVASQGAYACLTVFLAPTYCMYIVEERWAWVGTWGIAGKAMALVAALVLILLGVNETARALALYGVLWSALLCAVHIAAVTVLVVRERRLRPDPSNVRLATAREVFGTFGWNVVVIIAGDVQYRATVFIMNLAFGVAGNAIFELGFRLAFYVRMAVMGATHGLEAVSARLSAGERAHSLIALVRHSTRLQALVALPAAVAAVMLAEPILRLWVGAQIADPDASIPPAAMIVRIATLAVACGAIAHGWLLILYGSGHIRRYAPLIVASGAACPLAGVLLLFVLPGALRFYAPAIGYAVVYTIAYFVFLPRIGASCLGVGVSSFVRPMARPALVALLAAPLLAGALLIENRGVAWLLGTGALYGATVCVLGWLLVVEPHERKRLTDALRRRLAHAPLSTDART